MVRALDDSCNQCIRAGLRNPGSTNNARDNRVDVLVLIVIFYSLNPRQRLAK